MKTCKVCFSNVCQVTRPLLNPNPRTNVQMSGVDQNVYQLRRAGAGQFRDTVVDYDKPGQPWAVLVVLRFRDDLAKDALAVMVKLVVVRYMQMVPALLDVVGRTKQPHPIPVPERRFEWEFFI